MVPVRTDRLSPRLTRLALVQPANIGSPHRAWSIRHAQVTDELPIRLATADDLPELSTVISEAFLHDREDETLDLRRLVYEPERTHVATDGQIVGTGGVLTRDLTVPGAVVPAAHVTAVAVAATHRRRGLLTRIMTTQLEAVRKRGDEPIAVLWASEGAIYGRFGYGLACWQVEYEIPIRETMPPVKPPTGRLRQAVPRDVVDELAQVYDRAQVQRPGRSSRDQRWWMFLTADPKPWRRGRSAQRAVLYEDAGSVDGYAIWRVKDGWSATGPSGEVAVNEVVAATGEAYAALWRFLLSIDLTRTVKFSFAADRRSTTASGQQPQRAGDTPISRPVDPAGRRARRHVRPSVFRTCRRRIRRVRWAVAGQCRPLAAGGRQLGGAVRPDGCCTRPDPRCARSGCGLPRRHEHVFARGRGLDHRKLAGQSRSGGTRVRLVRRPWLMGDLLIAHGRYPSRNRPNRPIAASKSSTWGSVTMRT